MDQLLARLVAPCKRRYCAGSSANQLQAGIKLELDATATGMGAITGDSTVALSYC